MDSQVITFLEKKLAEKDFTLIIKFSSIIRENEPQSFDSILVVLEKVLTEEVLNESEESKEYITSVIKFLEYLTFKSDDSIGHILKENCSNDAMELFNHVLDKILMDENPIYKVLSLIEDNFIYVDLEGFPNLNQDQTEIWEGTILINYQTMEKHLKLLPDSSLLRVPLGGTLMNDVCDTLFYIFQRDEILIEAILSHKYEDHETIQKIIDERPITNTSYLFLNEKMYTNEIFMKEVMSICSRSFWNLLNIN